MLNIKQRMSHVFAVVLVLGVFFFSLSFNIVNKKMNFYNKKNNDINQTFSVNVLQSFDPNIDVNYTYRAYAEDHYYRTKPLFRASLTSLVQPNIVHEMLMTHGKTEIMDPNLLRLNHYWGNRLYETENELVKDTEILVALQDMYKKV